LSKTKIDLTPLIILGAVAVGGYILLKKSGEFIGGLIPDLGDLLPDFGDIGLPTVSGGSLPAQITNLWGMGTGQVGYVYDYNRGMIINVEGTPPPKGQKDYFVSKPPVTDWEGNITKEGSYAYYASFDPIARIARAGVADAPIRTPGLSMPQQKRIRTQRHALRQITKARSPTRRVLQMKHIIKGHKVEKTWQQIFRRIK
jgi:hypothetical protein